MAKANIISLDEWGTKPTVDDSWLDKPVSEWPDNVLFHVTRGVYARTLMNNGEAKVTFGVYNDGSMTKEEILETYWNLVKHEGTGSPSADMARLDASVTLNLVETEELYKLLASDNDEPREVNYFLSDETATPFKRGRVLKKTGKIFKVGNASMYGKNQVVGLLVSLSYTFRYEIVTLGDRLQELRKLTKAVFERLVWMDNHRQFAGSDQVKKVEVVRNFLKERSENEVVQKISTAADQDPTKWAKVDWIALIKDVYHRIDRKATIVDLLNEEKIAEGLSTLTIGEVRELIAKALISPEHINAVAEAFMAKGTILADKRKGLANKRKRKNDKDE